MRTAARCTCVRPHKILFGEHKHVFLIGWLQLFSPPGGVITRHCAVERLVSVGNRVIYILPLPSTYKYHDTAVPCCDKQLFNA